MQINICVYFTAKEYFMLHLAAASNIYLLVISRSPVRLLVKVKKTVHA